MRAFRSTLGTLDRSHLRDPVVGAAQTYKEWHHFVFVGADGWDIVFNVSLRGGHRVAGDSLVDIILLAHHRERGWIGGIDLYEGMAARFDLVCLDIEAGQNRVTYDNGAYRISALLRETAVSLTAELLAEAEPLTAWNDTPLGKGHLNWFVVPRLVAHGEFHEGGNVHAFAGTTAYHDHNWGDWRWGDDIGWDWGFATMPMVGTPSHALTFVFDRTTDRTGTRADFHTLAVWENETVLSLFSDSMVRAERIGRYAPEVDRIPPAANLVDGGRVLTVPREFRISARNGPDWIDASFTPDAALQLAIPKEEGFGFVGLNETFGRLHVQGVIERRQVDLTGRGCFEFLA